MVPDVHVPFEQTAALTEWLKRAKPHRIILLGDVLDLHALTEHRKNREWSDRLERELRGGTRWLQNLRTIAPRAEITFIKGNHCDRWDRYTESKAPALRNLKSMELPEVLGLGELGIRWHDVKRERKGVRVACGQGKTVFCYHGHELKSKYKNSAPLAYCVAYGQNAHLGHSHKMTLAHATVAGKDYFAVEGGYLGNPRAPAFSYTDANPSWQRGWCVYDAEQTRSPYPTFYRCQ